jgi:hypothetical protein
MQIAHKLKQMQIKQMQIKQMQIKQMQITQIHSKKTQTMANPHKKKSIAKKTYSKTSI